MPALLVPLITTALGSLGIAGTAATIASSVILTGISLGAQMGLSAMQASEAKKKARRATSAQDFQQSIRGSVMPRVRHYGKVKVGGTIVFIENVGSDVYLIVALGHGTIAGIDEFFIGDKAVLLDADGCVTNAPFWIGASASPNARSHVRIQSRRGYALQDPFSLISEAFPTQFTADHRLNGVAALALRYKAASQANFAKVYNSSIPDAKAVLRGAPVFDPRNPGQTLNDPNTWAYTRNGPLHLLDYHLNPDGMNIALGAVDTASFAEAAEIADEFVPLRSGGSERRYECSGSYNFDEQPADVIERICDTFRGEYFLTAEGKIGIRAGVWREPTVTLTEDDIVSIDKLERGVGLLKQYNAYRPFFTSPDHAWQEQEAAQVRDEAAYEVLGREFARDIKLPFVTSHSQAQRLAKIRLYEENPPFSGEITCHMTALDLIDQRVFRLLLADPALDLVCRVTSLRLPSDLSTITVAFDAIPEEAYAWDAEVDEGDAPLIPPETADDSTSPAAPTGFTVTTETASSIMRSGVRWECRDRAGQVFDFRWMPVGGDWTTVTGLTAKGAEINPVTSGDSYDAEARVRTAEGGISPWGSVSFDATNFTATSLAAPTALAATAGPESVELRAVQSADLDAWALQYSIYPVAGSASFDTAHQIIAAPGVSVAVSQALAAGDYRAKVRAISIAGGLVSAETAYVSFTVASIPAGGGSGGGTGGDGAGAGGSGGTGAGAGGGGNTGGADAGGVY